MKDIFVFSRFHGIKKLIRRLIACGCILLTVFVLFNRYYKLANSARGAFYEFNNFIDNGLIDVLCIGSSHMYCHINPVQMYDDYGIAAFDMGAGSQTVPFSYYYLEEAFKTQSPYLVILDVYLMIGADSAEKEKAQANFMGMKPSYTKYRALRSIDGLDNLADVFWNFPIMHTRYSNINAGSYYLEEGSSATYLGYSYQTNIQPYDSSTILDIGSVIEVGSVSERKELYLRKCIELCKENNVDIVLVNSPFPEITEDDQKVYNFVQQIADEYGVEFLNGCLYTEAMELDYMTDYMGERHLNYLGAAKYTKWLTEYLLMKGYVFPDRRGDKRYEYWEEESKRLNYMMLRDLKCNQMEFTELMDFLRLDDNFYYILIYNGTSDALLPEYDEYLRNLGIILDAPKIFIYKKGELVWQSYFSKEETYADYIQGNWIKVTGNIDQFTVSICDNCVGIIDKNAGTSICVFAYNEFMRSYYIGREYLQIY